MYKFFSKTDNSKDAIGKSSVPKSKEEAYSYFASIKQMDVNTFKKLFDVEREK